MSETTATAAADANSAEFDAAEDEAPTGELIESDGPNTNARRFIPAVLAAALAMLLLFVAPPLSTSGLWDPYELNVADLARRIALNLLGGSDLALNGADNSLPHLNDLGRPELPFTSIALGFRLFGLHEWAGRLPLAIWGFAGIMATYGFLARLVDRRAGLFAAIALTTMPLYLVQARAMMGDVVAMSAAVMAFGGLSVAVFDRDETGPRITPARIGWLAVAIVGLVSGFHSRGGVLGVGVPAVGVGLAWRATASATSSAARPCVWAFVRWDLASPPLAESARSTSICGSARW
jgi:4-amino-4-deoxy-L-arabinose transferase-like glycosyltransferase